MDQIQKDWLLETFFKNEKYAGWRNIAEKLIDTGQCITTKQGDDIWKGGIGNFIDSENYEGGVDLIRLTFNVNKFASVDNMFFLEEYKFELGQVQQKQDDLIKYSNSISDLVKL